MSRCKYATVRTDCMCGACMDKYDTARRLVDRGVDLRDLHEYIRPWVVKVREERSGVRSPGSGGVAGPQEEDGAGPWHENAVGELEDLDDSQPFG